MVDQKLSEAEHKKVLTKLCPDCGGHLREYASGGLSLNLECTSCHQCFGDYWVFGGERINSPFVEQTNTEETK